jgi:ParB-like chromosome segregation protein Spo0J
VCRISGASSIETQGVLARLLVREVDDTKEVIAGERRLRAAKLAALHATGSVDSETLEFGLQ